MSITVTDDDGASATRKLPAPVINVAPAAVSLKPVGAVTARQPASFAVDFTDPGRLDKHTVTVDWGDGGAPQTFPVAAGARHVELPHGYAAAGNYPVKVKVTDDDGAAGSTVVSIQALSAS
jgi:hypothetical protein